MIDQKRSRRLKHPLVVLTATLGLLSLAGSGVAAAQGGGGPQAAEGRRVALGHPDPARPGVRRDRRCGPARLRQHRHHPVGDRRRGLRRHRDAQRHRLHIPCNLIVQMPANTLTWADFVNGGLGRRLPVKGLELRVVGNMVGAKHIAGLAFAPQQSANVGTGVITGFDYATGTMRVADANAGNVTVQINDPVVDGLVDSRGNPTGRFSAGQSPDAAVQRRPGEPDHPRGHRLPDVHPAHRPHAGRRRRPAVPAAEPPPGTAVAQPDRHPGLPQLQRGRCRAARPAASSAHRRPARPTAPSS